jgi:putative transcriptional regulator
MAKTRGRLDPDGTVRQRASGEDWLEVGPRTDWTRVDATGEGEIARQAAEDEAEAAKTAAGWVRRVRRRTGLPRSEFARRIGVPLAALRDWEEGKDAPRGAARALLRVIDRMPEAALTVLAA